MRVVSFSAASGTGKTTLLEKVIPLLRDRGYRVGAIKHDAHSFDIDHPGKDSHRLFAAGAEVMVISSADRLALVSRLQKPLDAAEIVERHFQGLDLVLLEGFAGAGFPVIQVRRKDVAPKQPAPGVTPDPRIVAIVSDELLDVPVPLLDINNPRQIVDFLEEMLLT